MFTLFNSREYSMFRVYGWYEGIKKYFISHLDFRVGDVLMIYRGSGLVHVYYPNGTAKEIYQHIGMKAKEDPAFIKRAVKRLIELFEIFKPYYLNQRKMKDVDELRRIYELYSEYWVLVAIPFIIPDLPWVQNDLKELTYEARKTTQEYGERMEEIFDETLKKWYPHLGEKTRFVLPREVWTGAVKNLKVIKELDKRSNGFVFYNGKLFVDTNIDSRLEKLGIVLEGSDDNQITEFSGQIAQKGRVKGIVRVVLSRQDLAKVKRGNILVTAMTMPAYLPAMKKAAAFVTDEGGVTCHAAIIAREMKKPCVIGTKIATQVLRDGDTVEVDANQGKVTILDKRE